MNNIMMYHTIADSTDEMKLSVMENEKGLYMPSFVVRFNDDDHDNFYADNPNFIFGDFRVAMLNYINRAMGKEDKEIIAELEFIDEDKAKDILEILEKGIELGWHKVKW